MQRGNEKKRRSTERSLIQFPPFSCYFFRFFSFGFSINNCMEDDRREGITEDVSAAVTGETISRTSPLLPFRFQPFFQVETTPETCWWVSVLLCLSNQILYIMRNHHQEEEEENWKIPSVISISLNVSFMFGWFSSFLLRKQMLNTSQVFEPSTATHAEKTSRININSKNLSIDAIELFRRYTHNLIDTGQEH